MADGSVVTGLAIMESILIREPQLKKTGLIDFTAKILLLW